MIPYQYAPNLNIHGRRYAGEIPSALNNICGAADKSHLLDDATLNRVLQATGRPAVFRGTVFPLETGPSEQCRSQGS